MNNHIAWSPGVTLDQIEKEVILRAFAHFHKNKSATAKALGITVKTLDNKFERYEEETKIQEAADEQRKADRQSALNRSRGIPGVPQFDTAASPQAVTWNGMESTSHPAKEQSMPMPQRKEVQGVLPSGAAGSGARKLGR